MPSSGVPHCVQKTELLGAGCYGIIMPNKIQPGADRRKAFNGQWRGQHSVHFRRRSARAERLVERHRPERQPEHAREHVERQLLVRLRLLIALFPRPCVGIFTPACPKRNAGIFL